MANNIVESIDLMKVWMLVMGLCLLGKRNRLECLAPMIRSKFSVIPEDILEHSAVFEELEKPEYGPTKRKHLLQNSSLLGHMQKSGLLKDRTCFIEFGAGRGQLSYWLGKAMEDENDSMLLLVDKASHRHKFDNRKKGVEGPTVLRIRADIADLYLSRVESLHKYEQIVAISKHLCGAATDLALQCLINSTAHNTEKPLNITGIVMAFCCHHQCSWNSYTGQEFLRVKGFDEGNFSVMTGIASWATCGSGRSRTWEPTSVDDADNQNSTDIDRYSRLNLGQESRRTIGRQCKLILDYGRLKYLEQSGFTTYLVHYIKEETSPENLCLVAVK